MKPQSRTHLSDDILNQYFAHRLTTAQEQEVLEHTAQCEFCAGRFASAFPERELLTPPPDLSLQIMFAAASRHKSLAGRQREYYFYTAKVVLSMTMALLLLIGSNFVKIPDPRPAHTAFQNGQIAREHTDDQNTASYQDYCRKQQERRQKQAEEQRQYEQELLALSDEAQHPKKTGLENIFSEKKQQLQQMIKKYFP